ncbi:MAG: pseudouridine synthase [Pseudomonadota bacterium]
MTQPSAQSSSALAKGERIAKVIARAGLCSRRDAESWIEAGRVKVNGKRLTTPAFLVGPTDKVEVDDSPLPAKERTRLWLFHKPRGVLTASRDPEGRAVLKNILPASLKAANPVGRLDFNTEGLLLLTNDGALKRLLELPSTGWLRRYRVRAFGEAPEDVLDKARAGMAIEGVQYGPMQIDVERQKGDNQWLTVGLREGKNREVKVVLGALGLQVNRLIRISYGPFQLGELEAGAAQEVRTRILRDQLSGKVFKEAGLLFDGPLHSEVVGRDKPAPMPAKKSTKGRGRTANKAAGPPAGRGQDATRGKPGFIDRPKRGSKTTPRTTGASRSKPGRRPAR